MDRPMNTDVANRHSYDENGLFYAYPTLERKTGAYAIFDGADECIYVGRADDLRDRVREHIRGTSDESACIKECRPSYWCYEATFYNLSREQELYRYYRSIGEAECNKVFPR